MWQIQFNRRFDNDIARERVGRLRIRLRDVSQVEAGSLIRK